MKYCIILISFVLVALVGCTESLNTKVENLVLNKNKWIETSSGNSYSFTLLRKCFCRNNEQPIKVLVVNEEIQSAKFVNQGLVGKSIHIENIPTIKKLFFTIFEATKDDKMTIKTEYDQTLGFPSYVYIAMGKSLMDGDVSIYITDLDIKKFNH